MSVVMLSVAVAPIMYARLSPQRECSASCVRPSHVKESCNELMKIKIPVSTKFVVKTEGLETES